VHRDIKLENFVMDQDPRQIRLVDFGLANTFNGDLPLRDYPG
jgi:serine/threonine protein kinase